MTFFSVIMQFVCILSILTSIFLIFFAYDVYILKIPFEKSINSVRHHRVIDRKTHYVLVYKYYCSQQVVSLETCVCVVIFRSNGVTIGY